MYEINEREYLPSLLFANFIYSKVPHLCNGDGLVKSLQVGKRTSLQITSVY
jgi:hypothetical protein